MKRASHRQTNKYWLRNDLRHLYRDILKPQYKRYDEKLSSDPRDIDKELSKEEDLDKSIINKIWMAAENKDNITADEGGTTDSNVNLIKRQ